MKLSKQKLKQIIKEEMAAALDMQQLDWDMLAHVQAMKGAYSNTGEWPYALISMEELIQRVELDSKALVSRRDAGLEK